MTLAQRSDSDEPDLLAEAGSPAGNARLLALADAINPEHAGLPGETLSAEEVLFGPHACLASPGEQHWAAWELYQRLLAADTEGPGLREALLGLHTASELGYCTGCGTTPDGGYVMAFALCPTLALLQEQA